MNIICNYCIEFMKLFSDLWGLSYGQANCILFNILEPGVSLLLVLAVFINNRVFIKTVHIISWIIVTITAISFLLTWGHEVLLYDYSSIQIDEYLEQVIMYEDSFLDSWCIWTIGVLNKIASTLNITYGEINVWIYCIILPFISIFCYFISKHRLNQSDKNVFQTSTCEFGY